MTVQDRSFRLKAEGRRGVLLIHGLTGAPDEMKFLARRLHRQGFDVMVPQLAGHGADMATLLRSTWRDWLDSVVAAYDAYAREVDEIFVAGVCVGGALGLELAAQRPEIAAAVVYSMTFEYDGWNMKGWMKGAYLIQAIANLPLVRRISFAEPYPFGLKDERLRERVARAPEAFIEGSLDRLPFGALFQMYRLGRRLEHDASAIDIPCLIMHAREDDMSDPRNAWRLKRALGPKAEVRLFEDSYHMLHVDKERALVADETAAFFLRHAASAPAFAAEPVHA
ncbi:carboxylesterase [Caulobacter sp. FWC2]|uniref:alpha/beta hydrolase n=1 Tax=Caulobacter sp. FWC2 TaxID=69664 RepID=UPI000C14DDFE|nr:alpha/beta fold hydrolase [Caulobacter sp. FWC2]PIB92208.1 carboxylesterase [Caulobacter sp. FWC2]